MGSFDTFTNSCVPIKYKDCAVGTFLTNPCRCDSYFQCNVGFKIIKTTCAGGTLYDHTAKSCKTADDVKILGICNPAEPWRQCLNVTGADISANAEKCGGTAPTQVPSKATTIRPGGDGTGSSNTGVIVGAVVGVLLVIIIIAILLLFLYFRKRKQNEKQATNGFRAGSMNNPGYFTREESIYAKVDDSMASPVYSSDTISSFPPKLPGRPSQLSSTSVNEQTNGKLEDGYVEPSETIKKVDTSKPLSDTWTESTYMEVVDGENPALEQAPTPYDNSFR